MNLKDARISKNFTQSDAAKFLNIPLRTYKRYEKEEKYKRTINYPIFVKQIISAKRLIKSNTKVKKEKVVVVGAGYVGLSTAILLDKKANVLLFDINLNKINQINKKESPIDNENFKNVLSKSNFKGTQNIYDYKGANYVIVATSTDLDETTMTLDTFSVESVIRTVREINKKCLIVIKSTVPVGFTERMKELYGGNIIFCPEFLREKHALSDSFSPNRIIIGHDSNTASIDRFELLIRSSLKNDCTFLHMSTKEAEATKLFSNAYLAMRVSFFNELDTYSKENNMNTNNIINGLSKDPRIGDTYNKPSIMYGGYCLPKDTLELENEVSHIENCGSLLKTITVSNKERLAYVTKDVINKAMKSSQKTEKDLVIGFYNIKNNSKKHGIYPLFSLYESLKKNGIKCIQNINKNENMDTFFNKCDLVISEEMNSEIIEYENKILLLN